MRADQTIVIRGEKIVAVTAAKEVGELPEGAQRIDGRGKYLLPGLIDGHTHVFGFGLDDIKPGGPPFASPINDTREYRTLLALANAQKDLRAGFTTLRDLMSHGGGYADVDIKRAINRGFFQGPRMQVSTRGLQATGGFIMNNFSSDVPVPMALQVVDSPSEARAAVREQIAHGADWIKLYSTYQFQITRDGKLVTPPTFTAWSM